MKMSWRLKPHGQNAFSIIELLVVVLIIGILSAMASGVYLNQIQRARFAACRSDIRELETAINRYEIDLGEFPTSSSPQNLFGTIRSPYFGNNNLLVSLTTSASGSATRPGSLFWSGPYIKFHESKIAGVISGAASFAMILDPWGNPYYYCRAGNLDPVTRVPADYLFYNGTQYPVNHPLAAFETYFNPTTFQIFSLGPNETTWNPPYQGLGIDDVTNFEGKLLQF